jgi:hypothetical protein
MRSIELATICLAIAFASACALARAESQPVHRCIGTHGEIVFSGVACGAADATDAPSPAPAGIERSIAAPICPASADALRAFMAQAVTRRDTNAIAGVLRWDGVGGAEARRRLAELTELAARPLLGIDVDGIGEDTEPADPAASPPSALTVRTGSGDDGGTREHEFHISTSGGCYWLDW